MNEQFMLSDLARTAEALLMFSLVLLTPGYVVAWLLDLMAFRQRTLLTRLATAVPLSIGVCPIISYLLWRFVPPAVWMFYAVCAMAFPALLFHERRELLSRAAMRSLFQRDFVYLAIVAAWVVLGSLMLVDLQIGNRLYFPTVTYDYSLRSTLTASIAHAGVPAQNPFFFPGRTFAMHYHYFWFILCSATQRIAVYTISSRQAVIAGTIWCGTGLLALVALYLRFFQSKGQAGVRRRTLFTIALIGVTGLDIIPVIFIEYASRGYFADLEWWNEQVSAWVTTVFWTPHHLAGLIACLMGYLLVWGAVSRPGARNRMTGAVTAGLMFASAVGLSIYVTLVFAAFLLIRMVMEFLRGHRVEVGLITLAGLTATVLSVPFLIELLSPGSAASGIGTNFPFLLQVRSFPFFDRAMSLTGNDWKINLANLVALPINYFLELGFFLIVGVIQCKRVWRNRLSLTEDQLCSLTMAATSIVICTFVNSRLVNNNDLGWRGFLPAQLILLIWGGEFLAENLLTIGRKQRALIAATLVLGGVGSFYELIKIRFYPLLSDTTRTPLYSWLSPDRKLGARTFALREIYDQLRQRTPPGAIFQHNPHTEPEDFFHGYYADRQVAAEGMTCSVIHGGDAALCQSRIGAIDDLFENPKAFDAARIDEVCDQLSINVLIVKDTDKVWQDRRSWVWKRTPVLQNDYARAFFCSTARLRRRPSVGQPSDFSLSRGTGHRFSWPGNMGRRPTSGDEKQRSLRRTGDRFLSPVVPRACRFFNGVKPAKPALLPASPGKAG